MENNKEKPKKTLGYKIKLWSKIIFIFIILFSLWYFFGSSGNSNSEKVNSINTKFNPINSHSIETIKFNDPEISNLFCFISSAKTGGIKGSVGLAEDLSDMSLSCVLKGNSEQLAEGINKISEGNLTVYSESRNITFKKLKVIRNYDKNNHIVYYVAYSDKVLDGDSQNATSAVWLGKNK